MATTTAENVDIVSKHPVRLGQAVERVFMYILLVGVAAWLLANFIHGPSQVIQSLVYGIQLGALYALIALGYSLVYGIIELINFAHGDLFMLGTLMSAAVVTTWFGQTSVGGAGWAAFGAALIIVPAFCAGVNMLIEFLAYRRLRHAPKLAPLITAVGMSFVLQYIGLQWNGSIQLSRPTVLPKGHFEVLGISVQNSFIVVLAVTIPVLVGLTLLVTRTRLGKAMRAVAQDPDASRLMGINVNWIISLTFGLGGALAGVAGLVYEQSIGTTRYDLGLQLGLIAFTAAVLGGIGSLPGAVVGAMLIGIIQALNEGVHWGAGQRWTQSVVFVILILVMVFRPNGLMGASTKEKV
ncbi:MAG: branched-chain amino acid ABC transporter permease [Nocardioides sp.]|uniref:branched-chain amino acid ABC transporter permease n=1 Tax=Nocardioides sp. TaxID=35761 RepID=UPI0039E5FD21